MQHSLFFFLSFCIFFLYPMAINCLGVPHRCVTQCCERCAVRRGAGFAHDLSSDFRHQKMKRVVKSAL